MDNIRISTRKKKRAGPHSILPRSRRAQDESNSMKGIVGEAQKESDRAGVPKFCYQGSGGSGTGDRK